MEWWLVLLVVIIVAFLVFRVPYFQAIFEKGDREPFMGNRVVTPPEENLPLDEAVKEAEEAGTLDDHGMTRE